MMPEILSPSNEQVVVAFLRRIEGLDGIVATALPEDPKLWADRGFVTIFGVGGSPHPELPQRAPVFTVSGWANNGTRTPPWGKATDLVTRVIQATEGAIDSSTFVIPGYLPVRVMGARPLTEPERVRNDPSYYARVDVDLLLDWVVSR